MTRITLLIALSFAARGHAQGSLGADLDRVESRAPRVATDATPDVAEFTRQAAAAAREGRLEEAVALLDKAAASAYRSGATGRAFELSLTAAEALRAKGEWRAAANRFRHAALQNPRDPRAAAAHRTACDAMARDLTDEDAIGAYQRLLAEHRSTWPDADTAEALAWREVQLLARRNQWAELLPLVRAIPKNDPRRDEAAQLLVAAHAGLLDDDPAPARLAEARRDLEVLVLGANRSAWPLDWSETKREAALVLARGATGRSPDANRYALRMLAEATRADADAPASWRRRARAALAILVLLDRGESAALAVVRSLGASYREAEVERLVSAVAQRMAATPTRSDLLRLVDRLGANLAVLAGESVGEADVAAALSDAGRISEAVEAYRRLAAQSPKDRAVQSEYARLLSESASADDRAEAVDRWREIETREASGTPDWYAARFGRIRALRRADQPDDAAKLVELTRLVTPPPAGSALATELAGLADGDLVE